MAILAIIVLGSGFFVGLRVSRDAMIATADTYLDKTAFYDYSVANTLGLTDEDVEALLADPNVIDAEGAFQHDALVTTDGEIDMVYSFYTLPRRINLPDLLEGRLPEASGECLADSWSKLPLGTVITVSADNDPEDLDLFLTRQFTVVGICTSPLYLNFERGSTSLGSGSVTSFCYILPEDLDADYYTGVYLRCTDMPAAYTAKYDTRSELLEPALTSLSEARAEARYDSVISDAEAELADGWQEYNDGLEEYRTERADAESKLADAWQELEDARVELEDGARQIEDGKKELANGWQELRDNEQTLSGAERDLVDAKAELDDAARQIEDGEKELADGWQELRENEQTLADAKAELDEGKAELDDAARQIEDGKKELADGWQELRENEQTLVDAKIELDDAKAQLDDAAGQIEDGKKEIADGWQELHDNEQTLIDAKIELDDAKAQLDDAAGQIEDGKKEIADGWQELRDNEQTLIDAKAELDGAKAQLEDAKRQIDSGWAEYNAGAAQLETERAAGEAELAKNQALLDGAKATLDENQAAYDAGLAEYNKNLGEYNEKKAQYDEAKATLDAMTPLVEQYRTGKRMFDMLMSIVLMNVNRGGETAYASAEELLAALPEDPDLAARVDAILADLAGLGGGGFEVPKDSPELLADYELLKSYEPQVEAYEDGMAALEASGALLEQAAGELASYKAILDDSKAQLDEGWAQYNDGIAQLEAGRQALASSVAQAQAELSAARSQLQSAEAEYSRGLAEYNSGLAEYEDGLAKFNDGKAELEQAEVDLAEAQEQYDSGMADYLAGLAEYEDGLAQFNDGKAELEQAEIDLAEAQEKYDNGMADYLAGLAEYEDGLARFNDGKAELEQAEVDLAEAQDKYDSGMADYLAGLAEYEDGLARFNDGKAELEQAQADLAEVRQKYDEGMAEYEDGLAEYGDGVIKYNDGKAKLEEAEADLAEAQRKYDDGLAEYEDGLAEYEDSRAEAEAEFADAEAELADALSELEDARREIDDIDYPDSYLLGRWANVGYECFESDSSIVRSISRVFPLFFFLLAALICITTVSRMVEEQRTQLGVLMAMGYSRLAVMGKFLIYSGLATLIGAPLGILLGSRLIPLVVWQAYKIMYSFSDKIEFYYDYKLSLITFSSYFVAMLAVTWWSCRRELDDVPANVIRPRAPKAGKRVLLERVPFIWNRLSFLWKVTVRNIFRYKSRVFMMVLGVAGCTALMLTGMGINDSIKNVVDYQFTEISLYDYTVTFTGDMDETDREEFLADAADFAEGALFLHQSSYTATSNRQEKEVYLNVVDPEGAEKMPEFMDFHTGSRSLPFPKGDEALVNSGLAEALDLRVGDELELRCDDGPTFTVRVSGIYDNYIYNNIYVSSDAWPEGEPAPDVNYALILKNSSVTTGEALAAILRMDGILTASASQDLRDRIGSMMASLIYIVLLTIVCAAALAFVVIYNLTNINIQERLRELATVKVLGFYDMESAMYVLRENILLTLLGAAAGVPLGLALNAYVMGAIDIDLIHFTPRILPPSYAYAIALTILFSLMVDVFMYRRLKRINPAEALKAAE